MSPLVARSYKVGPFGFVTRPFVMQQIRQPDGLIIERPRGFILTFLFEPLDISLNVLYGDFIEIDLAKPPEQGGSG